MRLGEARRLPFDDASFDAVLLLDPLYHLVDRDDRVPRCGSRRGSCGPGGLVLAAAISRFASAHDGLRRHFLDDPDFQAVVARTSRRTAREPAAPTGLVHHRVLPPSRRGAG